MSSFMKEVKWGSNQSATVWFYDKFYPERFLAGGEAEGVGPVPGPKEIRMLPFRAGRRYHPFQRL